MTSALLLAAGKATRLEGLRDQYAKACVPVGNTTPLRFMMERLADFGVTEIWVNLHWRAEQVREHALQSAKQGVEVRFLEEPQLLGTGGTLLECYRQRGLMPDLVANAKQFGDVDFGALLQQPAATFALHPPSPLAEFGGLRYDANSMITGLLPKSAATPQDSEQVAVYTGICRPAQAWLPYLENARGQNPDDVLCLLRHGALPAMADGIQARAWLHHGEWCEVSTPERVQAVADQFKAKELRHREGCASPRGEQ
jgi:NDP-sugar pyrophosphorylase family protein